MEAFAKWLPRPTACQLAPRGLPPLFSSPFAGVWPAARHAAPPASLGGNMQVLPNSLMHAPRTGNGFARYASTMRAVGVCVRRRDRHRFPPPTCQVGAAPRLRDSAGVVHAAAWRWSHRIHRGKLVAATLPVGGSGIDDVVPARVLDVHGGPCCQRCVHAAPPGHRDSSNNNKNSNNIITILFITGTKRARLTVSAWEVGGASLGQLSRSSAGGAARSMGRTYVAD